MTDPFTDSFTKVSFYFRKGFDWAPGEILPGTQCSVMEIWAAHETGHAYGMGSLSNGHATLPDDQTIMRSNISDALCEPQPLDAVAMMALYQSR